MPAWYYVVDEQSFGPIDEADLKKALRSGELPPATYVFREGFQDRPASKLPSVPSLRSGPATVGQTRRRWSKISLTLATAIAAVLVIAIVGVRMVMKSRTPRYDRNATLELYDLLHKNTLGSVSLLDFSQRIAAVEAYRSREAIQSDRQMAALLRSTAHDWRSRIDSKIDPKIAALAQKSASLCEFMAHYAEREANELEELDRISDDIRLGAKPESEMSRVVQEKKRNEVQEQKTLAEGAAALKRLSLEAENLVKELHSENSAAAPAAIKGAAIKEALVGRKLRTNSLGMIFSTVPKVGVVFCVWETRVQDFEAFVRATSYEPKGEMYSVDRDNNWEKHGHTWRNPGFKQGPMHPVVGVTWDDATAFCAWLTSKEQNEGLLSAREEYRLPTDEEWSGAVGLENEAGATPREKHWKVEDVYPWGDSYPPPRGAGNYDGDDAEEPGWRANRFHITGYSDGYPRTAPVGSFSPNRYGLFDIGGNVDEFCLDWFDKTGEYHTTRGGYWATWGRATLSSTRHLSTLGFCSDGDGFRCVLLTGSQAARPTAP